MIIINLFVGSRYPIDRKKIRNRVKDVLQKNKIEEAQVDVSVVGQRKIKELNEKKLHHQGVTDVLSFPQCDKDQPNDFPLPTNMPPHLGDVVICFPEAVRTAKRYGKMVDEQICLYLEHGLMHLLGYHHE
ncbi:rRNA maturation RNase YbeY [Patescibacteria group bacterium]|nr:rRNA maturation RNase YbeY [Patescibacteria group bacterium]MBU1966831.1 rRNA maturation RNase YbeY [Patescibacteria group bacterium]MBU2543819.1 rRNA maturation RNase YbeY [Patescibacteria group bacterium]